MMKTDVGAVAWGDVVDVVALEAVAAWENVARIVAFDVDVVEFAAHDTVVEMMVEFELGLKVFV